MMPSMMGILDFLTGLKMLALVSLAVAWVVVEVISIHNETVLIRMADCRTCGSTRLRWIEDVYGAGQH